MDAVVTGGAGFIGSHLVDLLVEQGWDVTVVDDLSTGDRANLNPSANAVEGSVTDLELMRGLLRDAEYVFHLAALPRIQPSFDDPVSHEEVNVIGTLRCLEAARGSSRLKKFVLSSSSACYGTPGQPPAPETAPIACLSPYALQKYCAEQYALILGRRFGIPVMALRYFNVYGPRSFNPKNPYHAYSSVVGIFHNQKHANSPLTVTGDGNQVRDFVHVHDVARANMIAAVSDRWDEVYNVGCGRPITINAVAALFDHPVVLIPERQGESRAIWADTSKISRELGWTPQVSLEEGIGLMMSVR
jgi:UDP-glucose 4-epimerase